MNAFRIKVIAIIAMLVDHFALLYFPHSLLLQIIGRLSFPLVAWLIANGAVHTRNIDRYLMRLLGFAVLTQIPIQIHYALVGHHALFLNVLFTLFFGLLAIRILKFDAPTGVKAVGILCCLALPALLHADYGAGGALSILCFYLFYGRAVPMLLSQAFIYIVINRLDFFVSPGVGERFMLHPLQAYGLLALPIIWLYNGQRGRATSYFFYWFFVAQEILVHTLWYYLGIV